MHSHGFVRIHDLFKMLFIFSSHNTLRIHTKRTHFVFISRCLWRLCILFYIWSLMAAHWIQVSEFIRIWRWCCRRSVSDRNISRVIWQGVGRDMSWQKNFISNGLEIAGIISLFYGNIFITPISHNCVGSLCRYVSIRVYVCVFSVAWPIRIEGHR